MTDVCADPDVDQVWRVVIIEDSPEERAELRGLLLEGSGRRYRFVEVSTAEAGVEAILDPTTGPPDLVLLDDYLPDLDAPALLSELEGRAGLLVCPVVVITGAAGAAEGRETIRAGAQDFIGKEGLTALSLTRALENAVERWRLASAVHEQRAALEASRAATQPPSRRRARASGACAWRWRRPPPGSGRGTCAPTR